jgi:hypothetical protein
MKLTGESIDDFAAAQGVFRGGKRLDVLGRISVQHNEIRLDPTRAKYSLAELRGSRNIELPLKGRRIAEPTSTVRIHGDDAGSMVPERRRALLSINQQDSSSSELTYLGQRRISLVATGRRKGGPLFLSRVFIKPRTARQLSRISTAQAGARTPCTVASTTWR